MVLIPVLEEGERILNQLRRMEFLLGIGDIIIGDGGSKDTTGDPTVMRNFAVRALLVKTSPENRAPNSACCSITQSIRGTKASC